MNRRVWEALIALIMMWVAAGARATLAKPWSPEAMHTAAGWSGDARISRDRRGLRVAVLSGRTYAIAGLSDQVLPADVGLVRVRVEGLGGGARWMLRLYGDIRGSVKPVTVSAFEGRPDTGTVEQELDPRFLRLGGHPSAQVQLGVEGPPGAFAIFRSVEFLPSRMRRRSVAIPGQRSIACVDYMSNQPIRYKMLDWRAIARAYDRLVFDPHRHGEFLPLIWMDGSRVNSDEPTFGLPTYVGAADTSGANHEGINCIGAVLGATVAGIDKAHQAHDYVRMCEAYYNRRNGSRLVLNGLDQPTGGSFWYEIWPNMVFDALVDRYPGEHRMQAIFRETALRWADAVSAMTPAGGAPDLDHTAFDFRTMRPIENGRWREPDAAGGIAWMQYAAWNRFGDRRNLDAADACLRYLDARRANPYYEVLLPWGALTAARANAELGRSYDVDKLVDWCFDLSDARSGWGVTLGVWGGYDCSGLVGSVDDRAGYPTTMNTFAQAAALVPLVRYDTRYARAIGKWMLHLASAARLFYPSELPADHQSSAFWRGDPLGVIAYEGLRHDWEGKGPYATGDPIRFHWGPKTDLGLYGSSYAGFLGGIVGRTSDDRILALDCLATDFFHRPAYPTKLLYNPYRTRRRVAFDIGAQRRDLYDAVSGAFLARSVSGEASVTIPADRAILAVAAPAGRALVVEGGVVRIGGVVVKYR